MFRDYGESKLVTSGVPLSIYATKYVTNQKDPNFQNPGSQYGSFPKLGVPFWGSPSGGVCRRI